MFGPRISYSPTLVEHHHDSPPVHHLLPAAGFLVAALATVGPTSVQAQDTATQFQFPASRTAWINSQPFTRKQLEGKVAVMVFFEEG